VIVEAARKLGERAQLAKREQEEDVGGVELPRGSDGLFAQRLLADDDAIARLGEAAAEIAHRADARGGPRAQRLVAGALGKTMRLFEQRLRFGQALASLRGAEHRFGAEHHADAAGLAGFQRQEQAARLEIGAANVVDQRQADGHGAVNVDTLEVGLRDVAGLLFAPAEAAQLQPRAVPQDRQQRALGGGRQDDADFAENDADDLEPAFDVPADEQLLGGAATAIEARRGIGAFGGEQEGIGGFGAAAGVDERLAELDAQLAQRGRLVLAQTNRRRIQPGGAVRPQNP